MLWDLLRVQIGQRSGISIPIGVHTGGAVVVVVVDIRLTQPAVQEPRITLSTRLVPAQHIGSKRISVCVIEVMDQIRTV